MRKEVLVLLIVLFISASFASVLPTASADDDFSSATLLQSGVKVEGIVNEPAGTDSHDYYRIDVSIGDSIVFELGSEDYANFCIFEGTSNEIACYGWVESVVKHYVHAQNDTYYVEVTCQECEWGGVSGEYNITATVYTDEAGDSMNESTYLEPETLVSGTAIGTDADYFHTPVVNGDTIHVVIDSDDGHMTSYSIYDENENEIQNGSELGDHDFNVSITDSGNLTIELTCAFEEQCNYSLIASGSSYVPDTDGDGVSDDLDQCEGHDDNIDVDNDGTPDGCDSLLDNDDDGVANSEDACEGHDDNIDVDNDGTPDGCDSLLDNDDDGVANSEDACEGHDDNIDVDNDGTPDGCDSLLDNDDDGVANNVDEFPDDANESVDSDDDGVGDNADSFPDDANESVDSDDDGVGDNADAFPNDANESVDSDDDGVGDNADAFPNDGTKSSEADEGEEESPNSDDTDDSGFNLFMIPLLIIGILGILLIIPRLKNVRDERQFMTESESEQHDETRELKEETIPRKDEELHEATKVLAVATTEKDSRCKKEEELARQAKKLQEDADKAAKEAAEKESDHAKHEEDIKHLKDQKKHAEKCRDGFADAVNVIIDYAEKIRKRGDISGAKSVESNVKANADAHQEYRSQAEELRKNLEKQQPKTEDFQKAAEQARKKADDLQTIADKAIAKAEEAAKECQGAQELVKEAKGKQTSAFAEAKTARKIYAEQAVIANRNVENARKRREYEREQDRKEEEEKLLIAEAQKAMDEKNIIPYDIKLGPYDGERSGLGPGDIHRLLWQLESHRGKAGASLLDGQAKNAARLGTIKSFEARAGGDALKLVSSELFSMSWNVFLKIIPPQLKDKIGEVIDKFEDLQDLYEFIESFVKADVVYEKHDFDAEWGTVVTETIYFKDTGQYVTTTTIKFYDYTPTAGGADLGITRNTKELNQVYVTTYYGTISDSD